LASAAILLLLGRRADRWGHLLGVTSVVATFGLAVADFVALRGADGHAAQSRLFPFLAVGGLKVDVGLLLDPLSVAFVLLITGVGSLIHLYAVGYLADDPGRRRFFGFFNLFIAAMLLLVLGDSYLLLYVGWEGVGLASYLLISFWFTRPSAATAGKKAFLMNRVGDAGFSLAIFMMFAALGSVSFVDVANGAGGLSEGTATAIGLMLLLGACGKSGQFPLQAWLPDAMEGPTPVSALIHAATMVTAGVYLIARSHPIFDAAPNAQTAVVCIGAATLLIGSIIGCAKDDIKRILAYSTVSQIGYMFLAVGLGGAAYALGLIHLLAHGFFKAGLFLGAGSVMHGMSDQTDIRRFGGLWKYMKITWVTTGLGYLALIGIPPLSGFFTKEPVIAAAFHHEGRLGPVLGTAALLGSGLTAFYMTRLFVLTFHGPKRWTDDIDHPHESGPVMTIPLIVLAVGSVAFGGLMATPILDWLEPVFHFDAEAPESWAITGATMAITLAGAGLAVALFRRGTATEELPVGTLVRAARRNLYADTFNEAVFEMPGKYLTRFLVFADNRGVDGLVNGLAAAVGGTSGRLRRLQTGFVRSYAMSILGGALLIMVAMLAVTLG
jgi:NADH-quinone oxidoreductase subunit L